jgi:enamine deaminase RidA (YjgF/YER057c/UK114 family)
VRRRGKDGGAARIATIFAIYPIGREMPSTLPRGVSQIVGGDAAAKVSSRSKGQAIASAPSLEEICMKFIPALAAAAAVFASAGVSHAQTMVKHIQSEKSPIAQGVWAGDTYYLSGQLADPITPADPATGAKAVYATDTKTQAASVFAKIQKALQEQGLDMKDVVKLTVFLGPDPKTGKLDFMGMQSEYVKYFGTPEQPNKPARSAFQVAALAAPWGLLEVEAIAVRSH